MSKIQTFTGKRIDLFNPKPDDISIVDIAVGIASRVRFSGQTRKPISVAQHSIELAKVVPDHLVSLALFHDASEAYLGDVPSPVKKHLKEFVDLENNLMRVIAEKFCIDLSLMDELHWYDKTICQQEAQMFMNNPQAWAFEEGTMPFGNLIYNEVYDFYQATDQWLYSIQTA